MKNLILYTSLLGLTGSLSAAFTVFEDFESGTAGWTNSIPSFSVVADPTDATNNILGVGSNSGTATLALPSAIDTASTATLFFQMYFPSGSNANRAFAGLSASSVANPTAGDFNYLSAYAGGITGSDGFGARDGGSTLSAGSPTGSTWYNLWLVIDNSADTYDVYINSGTATATAGDLLFSGIDFRTGADGAGTDLETLAILTTGNSTGTAYFDNFAIDTTGANLSVIPEPSTYALLFGTLGLGLAFWRRSRK